MNNVRNGINYVNGEINSWNFNAICTLHSTLSTLLLSDNRTPNDTWNYVDVVNSHLDREQDILGIDPVQNIDDTPQAHHGQGEEHFFPYNMQTPTMRLYDIPERYPAECYLCRDFHPVSLHPPYRPIGANFEIASPVHHLFTREATPE